MTVVIETSAIRHAVALCLAAALLSACGGGGSNGSAAPPEARPEAVVGSEQDLSRYLGRWTGDCALAYLNGGFHAVRYTFNMSAVATGQVSGTLSMSDYGLNTVSCITQPSGGGSWAVTLVVDNTAATATGIVSGSADRVTITQSGAAGQVVYIAFKADYTKFWLNSSSSYSNTDVTYTKANL